MEAILEFINSEALTQLIIALFGSSTVITMIWNYLVLKSNRKLKGENNDLTEVKENQDTDRELLLSIAKALIDANMPVETKEALRNQINKTIDVSNAKISKVVEIKEVVDNKVKSILETYVGEDWDTFGFG